MKIMRCLALIWVIAAQSAWCADASLERKIASAFPRGWHLAETAPKDIPSWSFSKDDARKLVFVGPAKTGYSYFRDDGSLIGNEYFMRESIEVWIAPSKFDPKLTFKNKLLNSFSISPKHLPQVIRVGSSQVYLLESIYVLDSPYKKTSPTGTHAARPIEFTRTWKNWFSEIKRHVEQDAAANP